MFHNKPSARQVIKKTATTLLAILFALSAGFLMLVGFGLKETIPEMSELREIRHQEASRVYSADGSLLGSYFFQNRSQVDLEDISPTFIDALISIEDVRFYEHNGIDRRALLRVAGKTLLLNQAAGGGSTITQQLAKNLYPRNQNSILELTTAKVREMITARRLEKLYSKNEILELYLNTVSFGEETFGLETASLRFFSKSASELELPEAAVLAGVLKAPGMYNPHRQPDRALHRRNVVLRQMERYGKIDSHTADLAIAAPLGVEYNRVTVNEGPAPYFREHLRMELQEILQNRPGMDGRTYNLYGDGLTIQTTIDSRIQQAAEDAMASRMKALQDLFDRQQEDTALLPRNDPAIVRAWRNSSRYRTLVDNGASAEEIERVFHRPVPTTLFSWEGDIERHVSPHDSLMHYLSFLNAGFLAISPHNGDVLAWVGGIRHKYFQYDHVKSIRQAGSAFKPVIYSTALEGGMKPCDYQRNRLSTYIDYDEWTPRNTREEYGGYVSMQAALANSVNTIAVDLLMETGIDDVRSHAASLGFTSYIPMEPSIALGTAEVSLREMVGAYAAFASGGYRTEPHYIKSVHDSRGRLIYQFENPNRVEREPVISRETAGAIISMLTKAVNDGTGTGLRNRFGINHAVAGKTGTTQNYTDGWFIGMTPDLVFGSWVGGSSPRIRFSATMGYASQTALPIVGVFLQNLANDTTLVPQPDTFHAFQEGTFFNTECEDFREDSTIDRFRDFFTGRSSNEPRRVETDQEKGSGNLIDQVRSFFGGN